PLPSTTHRLANPLPAPPCTFLISAWYRAAAGPVAGSTVTAALLASTNEREYGNWLGSLAIGYGCASTRKAGPCRRWGRAGGSVTVRGGPAAAPSAISSASWTPCTAETYSGSSTCGTWSPFQMMPVDKYRHIADVNAGRTGMTTRAHPAPRKARIWSSPSH